ncbi:MAG: alginate export family protein [Prevotella sp.]|jgi:hypothetical protein|nr:alginate export family protein [Prevotella sp.]
MKNKLFLLYLVVFSLYNSQSFGQTVKAEAEIRSRGEYRDGFREPLINTLNASYVNNLRTKLNLFYGSRDVIAKLTLLDARTYGGTEAGKTGNGTGILEAWGEYGLTPEFSFAIGRQGLEYDDKRLFSYNDWNNTPGAHDLLLLKYKTQGLTVHIGSAYNNSGDSILFSAPYTLSYKTLNYIWLHKEFSKISASVLWVNDGFERGSTKHIEKIYRNTVGGNLRLTDKESAFTFKASGYYQFGHDKSDKSLRAYLLSATAQKYLPEKWSVQAGGDIFSGSKYDIATDKSNTFNKLYGTNHAFNGSIEYWGTLPAQGLIDLYIGATAKISSKIDANLTFHKFSTAREINQNGNTNAGSEIDITANYNVNRQFSLQGGWSSYFTTKGTDILKKKTGVDTRFPQWAYIQLTFKPSFFDKEL